MHVLVEVFIQSDFVPFLKRDFAVLLIQEIEAIFVVNFEI